jgi:glycosyltransferase involved in cell wall biosynthesis
VIPWDLGEPGGVSQVVSNLHRELGTLGWAPAVLVSTWAARTPERDSAGQIPVFRWRVRSPWVQGHVIKGLVAFLLGFSTLGRTWRRLAERHNWQIVNVHYPDFSAFTWIALKRTRLWSGKVVLSVHGREVRDAMHEGGGVERWLMQCLLGNADAVVACSADLAEDVIRLAPKARKHVAVIPNGISTDVVKAEFDRAFVLPSELSSCRFILNVATFEHKKSQDVLIDAFALISAQHPDVHLALAGRATPWVEEVRRRAVARGVSDRVHVFVNLPHNQILTFLSRCSVFCLPSRSEGHPLAILEAAVFGVPVVSTPVGGIPQTIPDESHGLLVTVSDVPALAEALNRVLGDSQLASTLGSNLQRLVATEFTWAKSAQRYADLVGGHRAADRLYE